MLSLPGPSKLLGTSRGYSVSADLQESLFGGCWLVLSQLPHIGKEIALFLGVWGLANLEGHSQA
jgi:hypothetical protein